MAFAALRLGYLLAAPDLVREIRKAVLPYNLNAFSQIAEELRRQYSLGYYPSTRGKEGERRQIKVRVTESDLVVKARDSYIYSDKAKKFAQATRLNP